MDDLDSVLSNPHFPSDSILSVSVDSLSPPSEDDSIESSFVVSKTGSLACISLIASSHAFKH